MRFVCHLIVLFFATSILCFGEGAEAPAKPPNVLLRIVQAVESSNIDRLISKQSEPQDTYHLRDAHYLGYTIRDGKTYTVAWLFYIRSRPEGRDTPSARGHAFMVILDSDFKIVSHGNGDGGPYRMDGDKLFSGDTEVADFQSRDLQIRNRGYPIGSSFLPYPFPDRISDEE